MSEKYSTDSSSLEYIDGVLHYESSQNGVLAYRPCPPELVSLIRSNQQLSIVEEEEIFSDDVKFDERKERRHLSPKLIRGMAKIAIFGAVLVGAHVGANMATAQTISGGRMQVDIGQGLVDLWSDVTLPLRMAAGK